MPRQGQVPAARPFPDVPVLVLSAARGFPRRFRAHGTGLQKDLAAVWRRAELVDLGAAMTWPSAGQRPDLN
jgi:hypothetical protein